MMKDPNITEYYRIRQEIETRDIFGENKSSISPETASLYRQIAQREGLQALQRTFWNLHRIGRAERAAELLAWWEGIPAEQKVSKIVESFCTWRLK